MIEEVELFVVKNTSFLFFFFNDYGFNSVQAYRSINSDCDEGPVVSKMEENM